MSGQAERQRLTILEREVESLARMVSVLHSQTKVLHEMIENINGVNQ